MKKIKLITAVVLFFAAFNLTSCDNEPLDPSISLNNGGNNNGNNGGGGTSSGDYWPAALNNEWNFVVSGNSAQQFKIVSINSINGATYYTFAGFFGSEGPVAANAINRLKKVGGDYYIKTEEVQFNSGGITGTMTGCEYILLKDYLAVGSSWNQVYTQNINYNMAGIPSIEMTTNLNLTIEEKGISLVVGSTTYNDIIKLKIIQDVSFAGQITTITNYYWFAKDIGLIKYTNQGNGIDNEANLTSHILN